MDIASVNKFDYNVHRKTIKGSNMKYYPFKYKSDSQEKHNDNAKKFCNFITPPFFAGFISFALSEIKPLFNQSYFKYIVFALMFISIIIGLILAVRYDDAPTGVFLFDDYMEIDRQHTDIGRFSRKKMNFKIEYRDILEVELYEKPFISDYLPSAYVGGIGKEYIRLKVDDYYSNYIFCVENQEELFEELSDKISS